MTSYKDLHFVLKARRFLLLFILRLLCNRTRKAAFPPEGLPCRPYLYDPTPGVANDTDLLHAQRTTKVAKVSHEPPRLREVIAAVRRIRLAGSSLVSLSG